jgi:dimethylaniline monooxygenase (N-oxide forming)
VDLSGVRTVGIIGAGVAGLAVAKTLLAQGLECTVLERNARLGGVWADGYSNFGIQVQRELYEYPDWRLPPEATDYAPGAIVHGFLEEYARRFGVWPRITFGARVTDVRRRTEGPGWVVAIERDSGTEHLAFDLVVVCIGLFSNRPHVPEFPGRERFGGRVIHVSELRTRDPLVGKKVVVVGYGKSATDAALESHAVARETAIVFREPHWPVPPLVAGILPFKWALLSRLAATLIPPYYRPSGVERVVHSLGCPLVWLWWRIVEILLVLQYGLDSRFGRRVSLVPDGPIEYDAFGESTMLPRSAFYRHVRRGDIRAERTEIRAYTASGLALKNGVELDADVVVLATGWEIDHGFLASEVLPRLDPQDDGLYLYRQIAHPDVPNLFFVGYASSVCSTLTYALQARWLGELLRGAHRLPPRDEMLRTIAELTAWKRERMPFGRARAARLLVQMQHYHDELLEDFGADPLRKTGPFAPLKELFAPYEPKDYRSIAS